MPVGTVEAASGGELPRAFGRYVLFDHIGRGGMADIYLASSRDQLGGARQVVLKQILPHLARDEGFSRMLVAEAKLAARLRHANVVQVIDLGRESERLFLAMEYVEGFDLDKLLRRLSKARIGLPADFALFIVSETLRALDYAHRARGDDGARLGIVHRDVSPSNVLVSFEGEVKLCDFGIARAFDAPDEDAPDEERVAHTRLAGKSAYMAPEHARGDDIDARADLFAAGILLWELAAGRRLYKGTEEEMLALARAGRVPALPRGRLPEQDALEAVLARALAEDRDARFPTAKSFLDALEQYAGTTDLHASQLRFGSFLTEHFAEEIVKARRAREKHAEYLLERDPTGSSVRPIVERAPDAAAPAPAPAPRATAEPARASTPDGAVVSGSTAPAVEPAGERASVPDPISVADTAPRPSLPPPRSPTAFYVVVLVVLVALAVGLVAALLTM